MGVGYVCLYIFFSFPRECLCTFCDEELSSLLWLLHGVCFVFVPYVVIGILDSLQQFACHSSISDSIAVSQSSSSLFVNALKTVLKDTPPRPRNLLALSLTSSIAIFTEVFLGLSPCPFFLFTLFFVLVLPGRIWLGALSLAVDFLNPQLYAGLRPPGYISPSDGHPISMASTQRFFCAPQVSAVRKKPCLSIHLPG